MTKTRFVNCGKSRAVRYLHNAISLCHGSRIGEIGVCTKEKERKIEEKEGNESF